MLKFMILLLHTIMMLIVRSQYIDMRDNEECIMLILQYAFAIARS